VGRRALRGYANKRAADRQALGEVRILLLRPGLLGYAVRHPTPRSHREILRDRRSKGYRRADMDAPEEMAMQDSRERTGDRPVLETERLVLR
jgi:hypothetical protein